MPVDNAPIAARRRKPSNLGQPITDRDQMHPTGPAAMRADAGDFLERHIDQAARSQPVLFELVVCRHGRILPHDSGALVAARYRAARIALGNRSGTIWSRVSRTE